MEDLKPDPRPTDEDKSPPISQVDQSKFMVYMTLGVFVFIIFMALMVQMATNGR